MLAVLMVVSLTACGRESVGTPGGELENGVAAIEDGPMPTRWCTRRLPRLGKMWTAKAWR